MFINSNSLGTMLWEPLLKAVVNKQKPSNSNKTIFLSATIKFILFNKPVYRQRQMYRKCLLQLYLQKENIVINIGVDKLWCTPEME